MGIQSCSPLFLAKCPYETLQHCPLNIKLCTLSKKGTNMHMDVSAKSNQGS